MSSRFETYKNTISKKRELGTDLQELKNLYSLNSKFYSKMDFDEFIKYSEEGASGSYDKTVIDYINQPIPEDPLKKNPDYYKKLFTPTKEEIEKERGFKSLRRTVTAPYSETVGALLNLGIKGTQNPITEIAIPKISQFAENVGLSTEKTRAYNRVNKAKEAGLDLLGKNIERKVDESFRKLVGTDLYDTKVDEETGEEYYELSEATTTAESIARPVSEIVAALIITKKPTQALTKNIKDIGKITPRGRGRPSQARIAAENRDRIREGILGFGQTLARGEVATQFAFVDDPEFAIVASELAKHVGDDDNKFADLINYLDVDDDSPEAARRLSLLLDGVVLGGVLSVGIGATKLTATSISSMMNKIKGEGPEAINKFKDIIGVARKSTEANKVVKPKPTVNLITDWNAAIFKNNKIGRTVNEAQKGIQKFWYNLKSSNGMFTPETYKAIKMSEYSNKGWSKRAADLHARLVVTMKKASKEKSFKDKNVGELFELYMTKGTKNNKKVTLNSLPVIIREDAKQARKDIDTLSNLLLQSKYVPDELKKEINENMGKYLRKTYEAFENPNYTPTRGVVDAARTELAAGLKVADNNAGKVLKENEFYDQQADLQIKKWLDKDTLGEFSNMENHINSVFGAKDAKVLFKQRKNLMPSLEKLLAGKGSVDITTQVFRTIETLAHQTNKYKLYDDLAEQGKNVWHFADDVVAPDIRMLQGTIEGTGFGALNGVKTTKEIAELFSKMEKSSPKGIGSKLYSSLILLPKGLGQSFATVYNGTTHVRNTIGGGIILARNGHNPFGEETVKSLNILDNYLGVSKTLTRGERNKALSDLYTEYLEMGLINQNVKVGDFKSLINETIPLESTSINGAAGSIFSKLGRYTSKTNKFITDTYVAEDDLWRIVAYNKELNSLVKANTLESSKKSLNVLKQEAVDIVRDTMPTYDLISPALQGLKRLPIGNFFSFHAEMFRNNYHTTLRAMKEIGSGNAVTTERGMTRLAGQISTTYVGSKGMTDLTKYYFGISDEEEQAIRDLDIAPWGQNSALSFDRDINGNIEVTDLTYTDPSAPVTDVARAFLNEVLEQRNPAEIQDKILAGTYEATKQFLKPFLSPAIVPESSLALLFAGRDYETGEYLDGFNIQEGMSIGNLEVISKHIATNLIPREIKDDYSIIYGKKADKIKEGELSLPNELFAKFTGQRTTVLDSNRLEKDFMYKVYDLNTEIELAQNNLKTYLKADVPAETLLAELEEGWKAYYPKFVKGKLAFEAAHTLGVSGKTINERINYSLTKLNSKDRLDFGSFNNSFIPVKLSDKQLSRFLKNGNFDKMSKVEFIREYEELYSYYSHLPIIRQDEYNWANPDLVKEYKRTYPEPKYKRDKKFKGGEVDVPFTKDEPEDRVDSFTGLPYSDQMVRLGLQEGGLAQDILSFIAQARGYEDPLFLKKYADDVKWQESRGAGPTTVQNNNGPARGSYQVEGSEGSSRNETILNRAMKFYEKYPDAPKSKEIEYALSQRGKDLDFSTLSEKTQDNLFYMDAERGTLPLDKLAKGELDSRTAWINHWNQDPKALQTIKGKENPNFEEEALQRRIDDWDRAKQEQEILLQQQLIQ